MANNINVKLKSTSPNLLDVEDNGGQNQVSKNSQPTTITWHLSGEIAQGNFLPVDGSPPGFEWVLPQAPRGGIFTGAVLGANGNSLSIVDNHLPDNQSGGQWIYKLRVMYQGQIYSTTSSTGLTATVNNPIIINKDP